MANDLPQRLTSSGFPMRHEYRLRRLASYQVLIPRARRGDYRMWSPPGARQSSLGKTRLRRTAVRARGVLRLGVAGGEPRREMGSSACEL